MNTVQRFSVAAVFVVASGVASVVAAPSLPAQLVTHWNAAGDPDGRMSKTLALALVPALSAALLVLFALLPRIDPLRENVAAFRPYYDWFVVVFSAYLFVIHAGILAFNLGYEFDFTLFILAAVAGLFYYIGILLGHTERNWFVGIRTPWTLSNEEVWKRTHELGGRLFKLTAVVSLVGLLSGEYAIYFLLVPALATAVITIVYSYYLYRKLVGRDGSSPDPGL
ncbi:SdpI family protein [Haloarchaeobius sp. DYHT-AS-18]|uniref:SdpI family protein n=1 Tax=Haloarchaeobius sp. DYHT-AS-18 TaxID=3446117 RepID=UPI003EB85CDC